MGIWTMHWAVERLISGRAERQTISKHAKGPDRFLGILTIVSAALLGFGIAAPFATVEGFFGLTGQYSLFTAALEFLKAGNATYAMGILVVFVLIPVLSIATAFDLWYKYQMQDEKFQKILSRSVACGRLWFFVMLGAISLVYYTKMSSTGAILHPSVYYLLVSVMMQKLILTRIARLASAIKFVDE